MRKVPISSIADVTAGQGAPKPDEFSDNGIPFIRAGSLEDLLEGKRESDLELVPAETAKKRKLKLYPKGSILFAKSGMSATKGRIYVLQNPAYVVSHLAILITKDNVYRDYLRLALKQFPPSSLIKDPAYPAIGLGEIQGYEVPIPVEIDDQKRIAHLLGKVEGLIAQRKQHLQQLDDLLKSVFLEMFGDPVRNEKGWGKPDFEAVISGMRNGLSPSKAGTNKGRVYTLSAITGDFFQEIFKEDSFSNIHKKYFPTDNDFLVCRGNGNINLVGKGYFFPGVSEGVIFPDTIIAVSIQQSTVNKHFLEALWKTRFVRQQIERNARTTNGAHKINQGVIEKIKIIQPPIELQNQFASIVEKTDFLKARYQQSLCEMERLYGALSQKAFKGELDLSRVQLPVEGTGIAEEENTAVEEKQPMEPSFELPAPAALAVPQTAEGRKFLVGEWLSAWLEQLGDEPFTAQAFMDAARQRLWELSDDDASDWGAADYDELKAWVFEALEQGRLTQCYDDANNRVQITSAEG